MKIELVYTLTRQELVAYFKYAGRGSRTFRIVAWILLLLFAAFLLWQGLSDIRDRFGNVKIISSGSIFVLGSGGLVLSGLLANSIQAHRLVRKLGKHPQSAELLGELKITLSTEGVHAKTPRQDSISKWHSFQEIIRREDVTYLMFASNMGIILPDRVFQDDGVRDAAMRAIERFRRESRPFQNTCPECSYDLREATPHGCPECGWQPEGESLSDADRR